MTRDEFNRKFAGRMLLLLTEAWACRHQPPSSLGLLIDDHARKTRELLREMYDDLTPPPAPAFPPNGRNGVAHAKEIER